MKRYDVLIVGAGPAGLSAAITAAKAGMRAAVFDENARPGGQLFKQIHKFFGSKEHKAKIRGYRIGTELLAEATALGVEVHLNTVVTGIFEGKEINVIENGATCHYKGNAIFKIISIAIGRFDYSLAGFIHISVHSVYRKVWNGFNGFCKERSKGNRSVL